MVSLPCSLALTHLQLSVLFYANVGLTGKGVPEVDSPKSKVIWESAKGRYLPVKPPTLLPHRARPLVRVSQLENKRKGDLWWVNKVGY